MSVTVTDSDVLELDKSLNDFSWRNAGEETNVPEDRKPLYSGTTVKTIILSQLMILLRFYLDSLTCCHAPCTQLIKKKEKHFCPQGPPESTNWKFLVASLKGET